MANWSVQDNLTSGDTQYGDSAATFTNIPDIIAGAQWIRTALASRSYTVDANLTDFRSKADIDVYVAIRDGQNRPYWTAACVDTGSELVSTQGAFSLYKKNFFKGELVSLGGNYDTWQSMYTVILKPTVYSNPTPPAGGFTINDSTIYTPEGTEYIMKGVNVNGPNWVWTRSTLSDINLMADVWGFNAARLNCSQNLIYSGFNSNTNIDAIVNAFTAKNMVSMIEHHDFTGIYPAQTMQYGTDTLTRYPSMYELKRYWVTMAEKFKNQPYVWFNLMNEPGPGELSKPESALEWKNVSEELIKAIRNTGASNIIVLDEHNWRQAGGYNDPANDSAIKAYGKTLEDTYGNLVFSLHMYGAWREADARLNAYIDDLGALDLPLIIGEYGADSVDVNNVNAATTMFNVCVPRNVGRMVWHWDDNNDVHNLTQGTTTGGGWAIDPTDGTKPANLSLIGSWIWDDNHNQLTLPVSAE